MPPQPIRCRCAMSNSVTRPTMLMLGRIGVALLGGAAAVYFAWALVRSLTEPDGGRWILFYGLAFAVTLVGTVAAARGRARAATLIAAIYGAVGLLFLLFSGWSIHLLTILPWAASVFALAVAVALRRAEASGGAV
jgi:hypothetical protein